MANILVAGIRRYYTGMLNSLYFLYTSKKIETLNGQYINPVLLASGNRKCEQKEQKQPCDYFCLSYHEICIC